MKCDVFYERPQFRACEIKSNAGIQRYFKEVYRDVVRVCVHKEQHVCVFIFYQAVVSCYIFYLKLLTEMKLYQHFCRPYVGCTSVCHC
jgi:hypothetical protein